MWYGPINKSIVYNIRNDKITPKWLIPVWSVLLSNGINIWSILKGRYQDGEGIQNHVKW